MFHDTQQILLQFMIPVLRNENISHESPFVHFSIFPNYSGMEVACIQTVSPHKTYRAGSLELEHQKFRTADILALSQIRN
jgi:hypothetical protein